MIIRFCHVLFACLATSIFLVANLAIAQTAEYCGDPPPVANENLKGDIMGQAQFLSRFLGQAELAGEIETSRTEVFSKYPDANERSNAFMEYQVCVFLMQDQALSTREKIDELIRLRQEFAKPVVGVNDRNSLFNTKIMSASKSTDLTSLNIAVTIESVSNSPFFMSYVRGSASAVNNGGMLFEGMRVSGVASILQCTEHARTTRFTMISPGSRQSIVFHFEHRSGGGGDTVHFSASFCIKSGEETFNLPVGVSNVALQTSSAGRDASPRSAQGAPFGDNFMFAER